MATYEVKLPSLVETSGDDDAGERATVSFVYFDEGDEIKEGDDLIEMVTDKATFNVPSPKTGTITTLKIEEDDDISVGEVICIMDIAN